MISPNTPPGTEVVCIEDGPGRYGPVPIKKGEIYTVSQIVMGIHEPGAFLQEVPPIEGWDPARGKVTICFGLERFRPLVIPPSLTMLLHDVLAPCDIEG